MVPHFCCPVFGVHYTLRHTAAQRLYDSTHDLELVRRFLGHVRIGTTQIYAEANDHQVKKAVANLDRPVGHDEVEELLEEIHALKERVVALST